MVPRTLAPAPRLDSPIESQGLEIFFRRTGPQLAGYFETSLFQGSALQLSLSEPVIRHTLAALGLLHHQAGLGKLRSENEVPAFKKSIQLYNRAIGALRERVAADPGGTPVVAMTNVLFICFEYFQGNRRLAISHLQGGIAILRSWRQTHGAAPKLPGGDERYGSADSYFLEKEVAPLLSSFNTTQNILSAFSFAHQAQGFKLGDRSDPLRPGSVFLNSVDADGQALFADRFESLHESKVALVDLVTSIVWPHRNIEPELTRGRSANDDASLVYNQALDRWQATFQDLARRRKPQWDQRKEQMAKVVEIMNRCVEFGRISAMARHESDWDAHRHKYEELAELAESFAANESHDLGEFSGTMCLDFGMVFTLHIATWKCRWPRLRRRTLDLLRRLAQREWLFDMEYLNAIFARIIEFEEASLGLPAGMVPDENVLPLEHARIHQFSVVGHTRSSGGSFGCSVILYSKPQGPDGPWHAVTEFLQLPLLRQRLN